jgi:hypothetical protein
MPPTPSALREIIQRLVAAPFSPLTGSRRFTTDLTFTANPKAFFSLDTQPKILLLKLTEF